MPASLFCEHKRLVSVCPLCGSARAGAATPQRGPVQHDVDETIHAFRRACHTRIAHYLTRMHQGEAAEAAYRASFDEMGRRGRVASEEEDVSTFRGGFYRAMVKMFDVTIDDRRIQGYNGLADWEEMRDYVYRKLAPGELHAALASKRLLVHGGNGAWPRQQIASELLRSDRIEEAVMIVAFGDDGTPPADADDAEIVARLARVERIAQEVGGKPGVVPLFSKVLHVLAPERWPALTPQTVPEAGEELGHPIPLVETPADYPAFAAAMRTLAKSEGFMDLARAEMALADAHASLEG